MRDLIFVHGMFQNPKSWQKWADYFAARGYNCITPAWPLHEGEPSALRAAPDPMLGKLGLEDVMSSIERVAMRCQSPIMIGHSVGGLITQIMLNRQLISAGVAISSVAPNGMIDLDWSFLKNVSTIANPLKGDEPCLMDAETFHNAFANTLTEAEAVRAFEQYATHDSRNVLRDCMGKAGKVEFSLPHGPLLFIGGDQDEICYSHLNQKNAAAYKDESSIVDFIEFRERSHYICGEPGWQDVAEHIVIWLQRVEGAPSKLETVTII